MCLVNDRLLSKLTPRFCADDDGEIMLPQKTIEVRLNLISLLRVANYEEFSL